MRNLLLCATACGAFIALTQAAFAQTTVATPGPASSTTDLVHPPRMGAWGLDLQGRDPTVQPGDDFYRYAGGAAVDKIVIPPDLPSFGEFDSLFELSQARVDALLKKTAANPAGSPEAVKVGGFYNSFMDEARVEQLDARPLQPDLDAVRAATTREALAALMGRSPTGYFHSFFSLDISSDDKDPDRYAVFLGQSGLGMPDRDYYLTPAFAETKAKYQAYVAQALASVGWPDAAARAADVVAVETRIAEASWAKADRRQAEKIYNPMTVEQLSAAAPGFPWRTFLDSAGLAKVDRVVFAENTAAPKIAAIFAETPTDVLQAWTAFHLVDDASPYLSRRFVDARFAFRGTVLSGQPELRARWKRAASVVGASMGEAVGHLYVDAYFPPQSKAQMLELVGNLKVALAERIKRLDWMSPATKAKALDKLSQLAVKVGYPDRWRDYSALRIDPADLYGNQERAVAFEWNRQVNRLDQPVDRAEWDTTPQTVNAFYNPTENDITFPAAILAPPFFDPGADPAVNYGAIGGVIGHEMTHGFDDQGRKYDGHGKLDDWWTAEDAAKFMAQTKVLGAQYSSYEPLPGVHLNGELTMGENIADLGGLLIALDAYHASLHGKPAPVIDGLTGDQRFFLAQAQVWRSKDREASARQRVTSDPHSPARFRVDGLDRNIDAWYAAFGVKPGGAYYLAPDQRVRIW